MIASSSDTLGIIFGLNVLLNTCSAKLFIPFTFCLLKPQDFNFNLLQYPYAQRIDLLPDSYKQKVKEKIEKHLEWLRPLDKLTRATKGFESGLDYMMRRDNNKDIQQFKDTMKKMDLIRNEDILKTFPELAELYE